ncbi:MAG TPA: ATP-binding cassette domain-containing protein, partial [Nitrososphaeraceae archaeon]
MGSHVEITNLYNKNKNVDGTKSKLIINSLYAGFHNKDVLKDINLEIEENSVTAFIGPSGCGKTTLIRCLNRMHEMTPGAYA